MNESKPPPGPAEPFLERWSRKKAQARAGIDEEPAATQETQPEPRGETREAEPATAVELPDLDSLDQDSDYSAFMAQGVDESLRREALRKLFRSPKFNVGDGLTDYCGDFTQFEKLGDIVTADMRFHLERAAKAAEKLLAEGKPPERPSGTTVAQAQEPVAGPPEQAAPEHPAVAHDDPDRPA
jgi:hypothetical protein